MMYLWLIIVFVSSNFLLVGIPNGLLRGPLRLVAWLLLLLSICASLAALRCHSSPWGVQFWPIPSVLLVEKLLVAVTMLVLPLVDTLFAVGEVVVEFVGIADHVTSSFLLTACVVLLTLNRPKERSSGSPWAWRAALLSLPVALPYVSVQWLDQIFSLGYPGALMFLLVSIAYAVIVAAALRTSTSAG